MASNSLKFTTDFIKIIPDVHKLIHAGGKTWSPLYALLIQIMHWEVSYRSKGTQIMTLLTSHNSLKLNPGLIYWTIHVPFESNKLLNYHCKNGLPFYCEEEWHTLSDTKHIVRTLFFFLFFFSLSLLFSPHLNLSHSNVEFRLWYTATAMQLQFDGSSHCLHQYDITIHYVYIHILYSKIKEKCTHYEIMG